MEIPLTTCRLHLQEGARVIMESERNDSVAVEGPAPLQNGSSLLESVEIARLGSALQIINQSLRGGEGICIAAMRPFLLRMLPAVLKIQVR